MRSSITSAWHAGLACLKPNANDLEHGLELHRQSLVVDAYAFSPLSPASATAVSLTSEAGASVGERQDVYESERMTRHLDDACLLEEYHLAWQSAGVTCIFQNAGEETQEPVQCLKRLARFTHITDRLRHCVRRAAFPDDIERAYREGARSLYFSSNAVPLLQRWQNVVEELSLVKVWYELGVRMMHLTYNRRNLLGDGCMESSNAGLSDLGRSAVAELNRVGIIVDVSHSGWRTSTEAASVSTTPIVASHTVCTTVHPHRRGKPDDAIRAIADSGGYVGICAIPAFLGGQGNLISLVDHLDYAIRTFGSEYVAIGTDRAHECGSIGEAVDAPQTRQLPNFQSLWPVDEPLFDKHWQQPHMTQSTAWTNWPLITVGLIQRGHSDEAIRHVLGGNVLRVARAAIPVAGPIV